MTWLKTVKNLVLICAVGMVLFAFQNCGQAPSDAYEGEVSQQSVAQDPDPAPALTPAPNPTPAPMPNPTPNNVALLNFDCRELQNSMACLGPYAPHQLAELSIRTKYNIVAPISCYFVNEYRALNLICARDPSPFAMQIPNMAPIYEPLRTYFSTPLGSRCATHLTGITGTSPASTGFDVVCQSQGLDLAAELAHLRARFANMRGGRHGIFLYPDISLTCNPGLHYSVPMVGPPGYDYITCSGRVTPKSVNQ